MKRLDEILSKRANSDSLEAASVATPVIPEGVGGPICKICGGAGFVRRERPVDHPRFGKAEACDCVLDEAEDVRRSRLERISNIGALARFTFASLDVGGRDGGNKAFEVACGIAKKFAAEPGGWLVLSGASGSGKTHLAAAIANERIAQGGAVLYMDVPDLLDHLRASYDAGAEELGYEQLIEQVKTTPLLVLDDIDAAPGTPWAKEKLFQVVNHRYNATLPTVFTCSKRAEAIDERLGTRLLDAKLSRVLVLDQPAAAGYEQVGGMTRERLENMKFGNFITEPAGVSREQATSLASAKRSAQEYSERPSGWFILEGTNGCGKTHLAAAIALVAARDGKSVFFAVVPDLLDYLRASFAPDKEVAYDELFERVRTADLLVLDDLGAQVSSPWAMEKLYQIVNYRTVGGLPTVVTVDQDLENLPTDAYRRIVARISDPGGSKRVHILAPHFGTKGAFDRRQRPPRSQ